MTFTDRMPRRNTHPEEWFSILLALIATVGGAIFIGYYPQYKPNDMGGGVAWAVPVWIGFFYLIIQMTFLLVLGEPNPGAWRPRFGAGHRAGGGGPGAPRSDDHQPDLSLVVLSVQFARGSYCLGRVGVSVDDLDQVRSQPPHHRLRRRQLSGSSLTVRETMPERLFKPSPAIALLALWIMSECRRRSERLRTGTQAR